MIERKVLRHPCFFCQKLVAPSCMWGERNVTFAGHMFFVAKVVRGLVWFVWVVGWLVFVAALCSHKLLVCFVLCLLKVWIASVSCSAKVASCSCLLQFVTMQIVV